MPIAGRGQNDRDALIRNGALILAEIRPPEMERMKLEKDGRQIPVERVSALIDTGAEHTCIDDEAAVRLGLVPSEMLTLDTAGGRVNRLVYNAALFIPEMRMWREQLVFGVPLGRQPYLALIGRDILSLGTLVYSGWKGGFEFCV